MIPTAQLLKFQAQGMLAVSSFDTVDDEQNFGASGGLSNKREQSSSNIWGDMNTNWTK